MCFFTCLILIDLLLVQFFGPTHKKPNAACRIGAPLCVCANICMVMDFVEEANVNSYQRSSLLVLSDLLFGSIRSGVACLFLKFIFSSFWVLVVVSYPF